jgi:hypothetical protein
MPYTAWPTNAELLAEINRLGIGLPSDSSDVSNYVDQAVRAIVPIVGYPLIEQTSADIFYDAPYSDRLLFRSWFTAITAVAIGVTTDNTAGTVLTEGKDFFFDKNVYGIIRGIKFVYPILGPQQSIKVTGTAGYSDEIPADLWQGVLDYAAALVNQKGLSFGGSVKRLKQADAEIEFLGSSNPEEWLKERQKALMSSAEFFRLRAVF